MNMNRFYLTIKEMTVEILRMLQALRMIIGQKGKGFNDFIRILSYNIK